MKGLQPTKYNLLLCNTSYIDIILTFKESKNNTKLSMDNLNMYTNTSSG